MTWLLKNAGWKGLMVGVCITCLTGVADAQNTPKQQGTSNLKRLSHMPLDDGRVLSHTDVEIEQDLSRPYVYVSRALKPTIGFDIINVADPANPERIYAWRIEDVELHNGLGAMDPKYFKHDGRYYLVQSVQFAPGGPDLDLGAVVFDVTGLPDPSTVREVGRIRAPDTPGGFHNIFMYKHSDGRPLLITTTNGPHGNIYDMAAFLRGDSAQGLIAHIPWPVEGRTVAYWGWASLQGYHDFYAAFDIATGQDKVYGAGYNGYYVYDITGPEDPTLVTSVVGVPGVDVAHTISASPDGRYAVTQTEYLYSPVRLFDLQPGLGGDVQTISEEIGIWTANWKGISHNHELRWPYVFVSSYEDGLYVFNMRDPTNPSTVAWFDTYDGPERQGFDPRVMGPGPTPFNGSFGVDVRNADGLIVTTDFATGLHMFHLDGFDGWNGDEWGMPNISSVQDWDRPPRTVLIQ